MRSSVPDIDSHAPPLPTVTTQTPLNIRDTQQPLFRPPSAHSRTHERTGSITSRLRPRSLSSSSQRPPSQKRSQSTSSRSRANAPEPSQQNSSPEVIHPLPVRPPLSPTMSHRSAIPPDNYIPMMDQEGNFIPLPPPHELSIPVPSATPTLSEPGTVRERQEMMQEVPRYRATSNTSRASTRISEYDLVSPPLREGGGEGSPDSGYFSRLQRERSPTPGPKSRRMVEEWMNIMSPSPPGRAENRETTNGGIDPEVSLGSI